MKGTKEQLDKNKLVMITKRALEHRRVNSIVKDEAYNEQDTGIMLFYGNEEEDYFDNPKNTYIVKMSTVLSFQPNLEKIFKCSGKVIEYDHQTKKFKIVE